jgi:hypothetical protein
MDILAHFLWTLAIYWQHPKRYLAAVIGFLPDILSFGPHMIYSIISGTLQFGKPELHVIPQWVFLLYDITHSIVIFAVGAALLWYFAREWFWLSWGWALHIVIDLPTHTAEFFPTPLLWPISGFTLSGISWATGWFMIANYISLAAVYVWLIWKVPRLTASR